MYQCIVCADVLYLEYVSLQPLLLQFCEDMRLMFDNAWLYNRKTSRVYKYCTKLSEVFESNIDSAMMSLGYCCGQKVIKWLWSIGR
jgi:endonuclease III